MWVIHSWSWYWLVRPWWGGRMYQIVTWVTSDVGVPSTYLVGIYAFKITITFVGISEVDTKVNAFLTHSGLVCKVVSWILQTLIQAMACHHLANWTNADFSSMISYSINLRMILQVTGKMSVTEVCLKVIYLKLQSQLLETEECNVSLLVYVIHIFISSIIHLTGPV